MFFLTCAGILEIEPTCGESEIRKAYFKKSKEYHPDKHAVSSFLYKVPAPVPLSQKVAVLAVPVPKQSLLQVLFLCRYWN
jgi:hypothetical protein